MKPSHATSSKASTVVAQYFKWTTPELLLTQICFSLSFQNQNIVSAVRILVQDLDETSLLTLRNEIDQRLQSLNKTYSESKNSHKQLEEKELITDWITHKHYLNDNVASIMLISELTWYQSVKKGALHKCHCWVSLSDLSLATTVTLLSTVCNADTKLDRVKCLHYRVICITIWTLKKQNQMSALLRYLYYGHRHLLIIDTN